MYISGHAQKMKKKNKTRTETCKNDVDVVVTAKQKPFKGQEISKGNIDVITSPKISIYNFFSTVYPKSALENLDLYSGTLTHTQEP